MGAHHSIGATNHAVTKNVMAAARARRGRVSRNAATSHASHGPRRSVRNVLRAVMPVRSRHGKRSSKGKKPSVQIVQRAARAVAVDVAVAVDAVRDRQVVAVNRMSKRSPDRHRHPTTMPVMWAPL